MAQRNRDTTSADARATNKTGTNATKDIPKPNPRQTDLRTRVKLKGYGRV